MKTPVLNITPGQIVRYHDEPCMVLEHRSDGTLLLEMDSVNRAFGPSNNYAANSLRAYYNGAYLVSITDGNPDEIITRTVDLTAFNGSTEYGTVECKLAPLTLDELRKYHDILPCPENGFEWSVTPWSASKVNEEDNLVLGLYPDGGINGNNCVYAFGSRSAFLIPSTLTVEIDGDEGQEASNPLERYTTKELAAELLRRMSERWRPGPNHGTRPSVTPGPPSLHPSFSWRSLCFLFS